MCISTDDTLGHVESRNIQHEICNILSILQQIDNTELITQLKDEIFDEYWLQMVQLSMLHDDLFHSDLVLALDQRYDYRDDLSDLSQNDTITDTNQHKPITRSATRKQQQQERDQRPDDDTFEDEQYYSRLNEKFNDVRDHMRILCIKFLDITTN